MSCCPLPSVGVLRFSYLWFSVGSRRSRRTFLFPPRGGPLPRASSLVNGSVAVSGNRQSSGPGGPAAGYCTISWHHRSVQSTCRKVVSSVRSSLPRTSEVASSVSRVLFPWLGYSRLLPAFWPRSSALTLPTPLAFGLVDPLDSIRHTFYRSPSPWSVVALYACFRPCGVDPDLCLTGFGIGVSLTVGWFLRFLVEVS